MRHVITVLVVPLQHVLLPILLLLLFITISFLTLSHSDRGAELETAAPASMSHVVARLEAFAGMSRMKRLALAVLCHTVTDKHLARLKVIMPLNVANLEGSMDQKAVCSWVHLVGHVQDLTSVVNNSNKSWPPEAPAFTSYISRGPWGCGCDCLLL